MSIAIDLPPSMLDEAKGYASFAGTTLEQFLSDCLKAELQRKRDGDDIYAYLMSQSGWLPSDYAFDREEANAR